MQIKDVMTSEVDIVSPSTSILEAARKMRDDDVGVLPVGEGDQLVGMITDRDIVVRGMAEGRDPGSAAVKDVMTDQVLYCFDDQSADEVAANMGENQIRRLPVVNRDKRLVGIVSLGDLSTHGATGAAEEALEQISEPSQ
jgi:CBS domain-containing protein